MSEPIKHGDEWWTRGADGSWLRWNPAEYRWDPQPGAPPFPVDQPPPPPGEPAAWAATTPPAPASSAPAAPTTGRVASRGMGPWAAPPPAATTSVADSIAQRLREFEPADGKGRVAQVLVGLLVAGGVVTAPLLYHRATSEDAIFTDNPFLAGMSTFFLFALVAAGIATIVWFKGAYDNGPALGATDLRYTSGWAIGGWLIPIGNFFIPKQLADDMWRMSDRSLPPDLGAQWKFTRVPALLHFWWGTWVGQTVLSLTANSMLGTALSEGDLEGYRAGLNVEATSDVLMVVSGILLIKIIGDLNYRQNDRARTLSQHTTAAAAAETAAGTGSLGT